MKLLLVSMDLLEYKIDYKSINFPIGLRHYFFLNNKKSKIYLNGAVSFNVDAGVKSCVGQQS